MNVITSIFDRFQQRTHSTPSTVAVLSLALAYGGGLWLHLLHEADGAVELDAPPALFHWLRDSTLLLPLVVASVIIALILAEKILERSALKSSPLGSGALIVTTIALVTSAAIGVASPIHNLIFDAHHHLGDDEMPVLSHIFYDGTLALIANFFISAIVLMLVRITTRTVNVARRAAAPKGALNFMRLNRMLPLAMIAVALFITMSVAPISHPSLLPSAEAAMLAPTCRAISADVVALDQVIVYNRLGAIDPEGMIFALRQDVVDKTSSKTEVEGGILTSGNVRLRDDKRPRPLTLRMNAGDCLTINFQNLLNPTSMGDQPATRTVGISVLGMQLKNTILSDGSNVGQNATAQNPTAGLVAPGASATYTFYAQREATHMLYSPVDTVSVEGIGTLAHGLFGAVNVEPTGAEWFRSQVTRQDMDLATTGYTADGHPVINYNATYLTGRFTGRPILKMLDANNKIISSDLTAIITGPGRGRFGQGGSPAYPANPSYPDRNEPFREFTIVFHDEVAMLQAFPIFNDPTFQFTLAGVRDGKAVNYGTAGVGAEIVANRSGVGPMWNCPECKYEEFFLTSWAVGDPAMIVDVPANTTDGTGKLITGPKATKAFYADDPSNVYNTYIGDHTKFRNVQVGKEHHLFHLHSHQWLETPDDDNSSYLDSQAIGPGSSYTYEIAYNGSGNRNKTPGDAIFHCHFYPHFAQGMWALWRSHDVFERGSELDANGRPIAGTRALPDSEIATGTPIPALVPIPTLPMAPMPGAQASIVNGQAVVENNGKNPGYPFFIPGVAGHRPPTPVLDMTDPATGVAMDGGLPRHVIIGGSAIAATTPLDFNKVLTKAQALFPPEQGTPIEQAAMAFHEKRFQPTFTMNPDGTTVASQFETNGLPRFPGAPFAEPCRKDDGTFDSAAPQRVYKAADIQFDMKINKVGWHFPQARMLALWQDVATTLNGTRAPEPFVMRANSGDCITYYHTNLIPSVYEQDAYQVKTPTDVIGQHIHLVKFDVTSSDGSGNGWNYEDGTLSPDEVRERIDAIRAQNNCAPGAGAPDDQTCPVAKAHSFFGAGPNGKWLGARTSIQRWYADPVKNNAGLDRTLGNVYTHDHFGPSTHQQTGLYATLIIEPSKSQWRNPETGTMFGVGRTDGGPTSWRADILTADNAGIPTYNFDKESFREFYFEFSDFQHAYVAGKGILNGKIVPDAPYAINPPGLIQLLQSNPNWPKLKVKPGQLGQPDTCPSNKTMIFSATGCPEAISTADIGTFSMNYRNEPVALRVLDPKMGLQAAGDAGDLSLALSSNITRTNPLLNVQPKDTYPPLTADVKDKDPYTPMMRTYEGDRIRIKVQVGATEEGHNASLWGAKWLQEFASPNSGWRNSQMMGISEQFNWDTVVSVDPAQKGKGADYLFSPDNSVDGMWNGMWGLLRSYSQYRVKKNEPNGTDLLPLPNNRIDTKTNQVNSISNLSDFDSKSQYTCPVAAPKVTLDVTAVLAQTALPGGKLVYNSRTTNGGTLNDPTAILYVRTADLDATGKLKLGVPIEPLILRARAGDCINLVVQNKLPAVMPDLNGFNLLPPIVDLFNANDVHPSNRVGLRPQLVSYDVTKGAGNSIGVNGDKTMASLSKPNQFWWYAGDLKYDVKTGKLTATPVEFGATNLISSDPIKHSNKGAIGALIIEPQGATWVEDANSRASATVTYAGGTFRDFVLLFQDDINLRFGDGSPVPFVNGADDAEDSGMKALNYKSEPLWFRLGIDPSASENVIQTKNFTNALANSLVGGNPVTPLFTAAPNQAIRLRVLQPNGHARNHVFALSGHVWERNPYINGSSQIGHNPLSEWRGSQEGHGPTDHWDIIPVNGAGGAFGIKGDYLYRDMAPFNFYNGVWGILRVQ